MCMKISFWRDRTIFNKFIFLIYKALRMFFTSVYFYFYPAISIMLCFQLPLIFRKVYKQSWLIINDSATDPKAETPDSLTLIMAGITEEQYGEIRKKLKFAHVKSINDMKKDALVLKKPKEDASKAAPAALLALD
mmetsp:Transcript_12956/g.15378  ORF Transcript_12956/g.15378 Transcript_12956/m.15378 type:complete len:135 (+) Transcript_12956:1346-1750(+)